MDVRMIPNAPLSGSDHATGFRPISGLRQHDVRAAV